VRLLSARDPGSHSFHPALSSTGEIEVQKESTSSLGIQTDSADAPSDALEVNMIIQTQAQILQSDSLALRVIEDLHLEQTEDYRQKWSPVGWVLRLFGAARRSRPKGASLENSPHRRMRVLKIFHRKADGAAGGRNAPDRRGISKSRSAAGGNGGEPPAARLDREGLSGALRRDHAGVFVVERAAGRSAHQDPGVTGQGGEAAAGVGCLRCGRGRSEGRDQVYSPTLEKLQMATQAEAQAQSNRILKGAINDVVKSGNAELISGLGGSAITGGSSSAIATSLN
jgi:succinoglycan biosynthesis transport protein ExoP